MSKIMERKNQLIAHSDVLAMNKNYHFRASSVRALAHLFPFSYVFKTKSRKEGRGVLSPNCRFKHHSKCPRNAWFLGTFHVKEAEESEWGRIGRKIIEQGVLQALALG